jgi:putative peptidoglycan lipid II flippase
MAPGFDGTQFPLAVISVRILLFQLPIAAFLHLFMGYLTARKSFVGPNLIGVPLSISIITVCLIMGTQSGVIGLSMANLIGVVSQVMIFIFWLPKEKFRLRFTLKFNTPEIKTGMKLLIPALLGSAVLDLNAWVDRFAASWLEEGTVAAIGFSMRLITFVQGLLIVPIAGIVFSYISEYAAKNEPEKMLDTLWRTIRVVLFVVFPIVIIAIPSGMDIVRIVYERGEFGAQATLMTGSALIWYLPSLLGYSLSVFLIRFFYALQDTKMPMICGILSVSANIPLTLVLSRVMGIAGIALSTSISVTLSALLLLLFLRRKMGPLGFGETAKDIIKMLLCSIPCVLSVLGMNYLLSGQSELLRFAASACVGGAVYLVPAFLLKEMALMELMQMLRAKLKKG